MPLKLEYFLEKEREKSSSVIPNVCKPEVFAEYKKFILVIYIPLIKV